MERPVAQWSSVPPHIKQGFRAELWTWFEFWCAVYMFPMFCPAVNINVFVCISPVMWPVIQACWHQMENGGINVNIPLRVDNRMRLRLSLRMHGILLLYPRERIFPQILYSPKLSPLSSPLRPFSAPLSVFLHLNPPIKSVWRPVPLGNPHMISHSSSFSSLPLSFSCL